MPQPPSSQVTDVAREKLTYIIAIKVASLNPDKAAKIANEYTSAYMDGKVGIDIGTAARQAAFFDQQLTKMGDDARQADEKIAKFEAENGIVRSNTKDGETITDQQVAPLAMQLPPPKRWPPRCAPSMPRRSVSFPQARWMPSPRFAIR
jgi:uncharacterized protein involved in exopolysaccharide biosynthesis